MRTGESVDHKLIACPDGSKTLHSNRFDQSYHSVHGALTESRHVFVEGTHVGERLRSGFSTRVLEVGFGLGLNCLLSADLAYKHKTSLRYHALENHLLDAVTLETLEYRDLLEQPTLSDRLLRSLQQRGDQLDITISLAESIELFLSIGDAAQGSIPTDAYHACYLDAFSPDVNPECWKPKFLTDLYHSLLPEGVLATYSARGSVRRALSQAGFLVQKHPGPPGKRDIVIAVKPRA